MSEDLLNGEIIPPCEEFSVPDEFPPPPPELTPEGGSKQQRDSNNKTQKDRLRTIIRTLFMPAAALILTTTVIYSSFGIDMINEFGSIDEIQKEQSEELSGQISGEDPGHIHDTSGEHGGGNESSYEDKENSAEESAAVFHTVVWRGADGEELFSETLEQGAIPEYNGETPVKEPDAQYSYVFSGWTPEITALSDDIEYTAVFDATVNTYTVTWLDADGEVLLTDTLPYGSTPEFSGEAPAKEQQDGHEFTFEGWSPEITEVTGDAEYTAVFSDSLLSYTVRWYGDDGELLAEQSLPYGTLPSYTGASPEKTSDVTNNYTFSGWSPDVSAVTGDAEYRAVFTAEKRSYTVRFLNEDGSVISSASVYAGSVPEFTGSTPAKSQTAQYTYAFAGWSPALSTVDSDKDYTATFVRNTRKYTVQWKNYDGTLINSAEVEYGKTPSYSGTAPTRSPGSHTVYEFTGWTPSVRSVSGNASYTAVFSEIDLFPTLTKTEPDSEYKQLYMDFATHRVYLAAGSSINYETGTVDNASYDEATNTLTLNGLDSDCMIRAASMGSDFKIKLIGTNTIGSIELEGGRGVGGSLTIEGSGELTINSPRSDRGIWFNGNGGECCLMVCRGVKVTVTGPQMAFYIHGTTMERSIYYAGSASFTESELSVTQDTGSVYYTCYPMNEENEYLTSVVFGR